MIFIHFEPAQLLQLLASTVFPLLVALVTQRDTHAGRRAVLLAALAAATTFASALAVALQTGAPFDLLAALVQFVFSFLVAVGSHFGAWKPLGAAAALQNIGSPAPGAALPAETAPAGTGGPVTSPRHAAARGPWIPGTVLPDLGPGLPAEDPRPLE